jgi:6-phosphogluconolactonase
MAELRRFSTPTELADAAAQTLVQAAQHAIHQHGRFTVALCGGTTPVQVYQLLAAAPYRDQIAWERVFVFWGDERLVPPHHPDSNFGLAENLLLRYVNIPAANMHRIEGERPPQEAAERYAQQLHQFFGDNPTFDVILLGMGTDGHTASLFPHTPALEEQERWVVPNYVEKLLAWRITLTLPVINQAAQVLVLVTGANKAELLRQVIKGEKRPQDLPIQGINPSRGELLWLVDADASRLI